MKFQDSGKCVTDIYTHTHTHTHTRNASHCFFIAGECRCLRLSVMCHHAAYAATSNALIC